MRRVRLYLHITMKLHKRKNLNLPYLHCYNRNISEIWRVENWIYKAMNI